MGKGSSPRPVNRERVSESYDRIFGKRCVHNRKPEECAVCLERRPAPKEIPDEWWDRLSDAEDKYGEDDV